MVSSLTFPPFRSRRRDARRCCCRERQLHRRSFRDSQYGNRRPKVGAELRKQAIFVTLYALGGMLLYIAFRFEWVFGAAAVLAVFHDVLITLGFFSLLHFEISLTVIGSVVDVGWLFHERHDRDFRSYSGKPAFAAQRRVRATRKQVDQSDSFANDFDQRINFSHRARVVPDGRPGASRFLLCPGGGIVVGTYSSFGIAAPLVVFWHHWRDKNEAAGTGTAAGNKTRASESAAGRLAPAGRR